ncbi:hypothetical protein B0J12DRAFT_742862 [Macrophomina phaseolina]|uniref:Uncharacterized protein n=1 Tax=Macrophomina phaseolina TaxID=35725 RepID=A0ABQ8G2X8_9PEZI|nr:hypothetical protein B0J12DRAFT_742862 [Macrophomina phaseolina]
MAEQITHDVVNEAQSMGGNPPIDVNATTTNDSSAGAAPDTNSANQDHPATSSTTATIPSAPLPETKPLPDSSDAAKDPPATDGPQKQPAAASEASKEPAVNGTASPLPSLDDLAGAHSAADTSGGSDTDTSRTGTRSAVKKPTSFKSVSVTKNFLAKTAVSAPAKTGEKAPTSQASISTQPTAKPRLVAKSGSGVGSAIGRSALSKLNGTGSGPDPNMVWNKNRPTPPPPVKQFTDEELKQQFGIHMATRLQADEDTKESKWADIDEDEDENWAPETVEWMDGTKSTVKPAEPSPPLEEPKPEVKKEEKPPEQSKPPTPSVSRPSSTGPSVTGGTKTILKPGAHIGTGGNKQGLVSKGQADNGKATLVAKSPAPTPTKSPWAPLPPVEKVSPVVINPQVEQPPTSRFSQKDPHGFDALPPAPSPAKEIAADDFNRSWRDDRGPRELFNSQSGRYEPVRDTRRGSSRPDSSLRQPSVLQRPSQTGPAEPSAAFQTSRSSIPDEPWARRRTSSNVSGGSGRRMSFTRDVPPAIRDRRSSQSVTDMPPPMPTRGGLQRGLSPATSNQGSLTQHSSPVAAHVQPVSPSVAASSPDAVNGAANPAVSYQEQVKIQEQMMREKIERARAEKQKRREEEEKEEAARKERLRLKLEALGPPPSKTEKTTPPPANSEPPPPQQKPTIQSPPKPPVPTAEGEVAQYGMMKVHQPHTVKRADMPAEQLKSLEQTRREVKSPERKAASPSKSPAVPFAEVPTVQPDGVSGPEDAATAAKVEQKVPAWKPSVASGAPWGSMRRHNMGVNVWGPPNQERGIGNGTFGHTQQPQAPGAPGPIAPPAATTKLPTSPPRFTQASNTEQPSSFASQPDLRPQNPIPHSSTTMASAAVAPPGPIAPPKAPARPAFDVSAWSAGSIAESDAKLARMREDSYNANRGKPLPAFNETFKQTAIEGSLDRRRVLETKSTVHLHPTNAPKPEEQSPHSQLTEQSSRSTPIPFSEPYRSSVSEETPTLRPIGAEKVQSSPGSTGTPGNRSSRFFPRSSDALDAIHAPFSQFTINGDSPPPPETSSHPVFSGNAHHPIVKLPQKIKVKLPPAASHSSSPVTMPARPEFSRIGSQPIVATSIWQERFNGLFGRASASSMSPPKSVTSLAVAPASKAPLDYTGPSAAGATVSLPSKQSPAVVASFYDANPVSKSAFEEVMSVPEAFSAPTVCIPKESHMNAGLAPVPTPSSRPGSRFYKTPDVYSIDPSFLPLGECEQNAQGFVITIHMPASESVKTRIMPRRRGQGRKPSGFNKKRNVAPRENSNSGPRSRKASGSVPPGIPWGNSNNNNKTNSSSSPWGRRTSGAVH